MPSASERPHPPPSTSLSSAPSSSAHHVAVAKPVSDRRSYEYVTVGGDESAGSARFLVVSDQEAVFAATCVNVQAGYFDDPPDVPGFAHWLEHAVHLGSGRYPDDKDYKYFLSQHGGASNASTGMVHTSYHFSVTAPALPGALDRLARFFIDPLLNRESILKEAENVHAEFSRNCNSDSRKLLQLRRSAAGGPLAQFSTGNLTTLRDGPAAAGADVPSALEAFWRRRYLAGALCGCIVGPQPLAELRALVRGAFEGVRAREEEGAPVPAAAAPPATLIAAADPATLVAPAPAVVSEEKGERYSFGDMCGPSRLGRLFRVASQRELRELEVVWYLPYGMMEDMRSKPWRWAGHQVGHEGRGSLAALLRGAGLAQELTSGPFDEVRLGRGFMFWGLTITLSEAGLRRAPDVMALVFAAVEALRAVPEAQRLAVWEEVAEEAAVRWQYQDRTAPLDLAKDVAQKLHYFPAEAVLSGPALMDQYDSASLDRFLSYLLPENCNIYLCDSSFAGTTQRVEQWYGARYSEEPLPQELYDMYGSPTSSTTATGTSLAAPASTSGSSSHPAAIPSLDSAGSPDDPLELLLSRLSLPPPPSWALPVDVRVVAEADAAATAQVTDLRPVAAAEVKAEPKDAAQLAGSATADGPAAAAGVAAPAAAVSAPSRPPPVLVADSGSVRLWHRTDVSFGVPKTHVFAHLITPRVYDSPAAWVTARLACRILDELLQPDVYDAQLVGTGYGLGCSETGLTLGFTGFSGVVAKLAEVVAGAMATVTLEAVQARYGLVHGKLLRSLRLWRHNNPAQHAVYGTEHLLQLPHWHAEESIAVLEAAAAAASVGTAATPTPDAAAKAVAAASAGAGSGRAEGQGEGEPAAAGPRAVWELLRRLGEGMAMEVLVYGNATEQQARDLCATLERHLRPTGLGPSGWPATQVLKLGRLPEAAEMIRGAPPAESTAASEAEAGAEAGRGAGAAADAAAVDMDAASPAAAAVATAPAAPVLLRFVPLNPNPSNSNSAIYLMCQVCEDDPRVPLPAVLLDLLVAVASKPAFHELRTRQRLGYAVSLVRHRLGGVVGLAVRVQSPDRRPGELREKVAGWLADFGPELRALSPEHLAHFKASLEERYLEPPRSLAEAAQRAWQPIRYRSYAFAKREAKAAALRSVQLEDLVSFFECHVQPSSPSARVLCCEVWGGAVDDTGAAAGAASEGAAGEGVASEGAAGEGAAGEAAAVGADKAAAAERRTDTHDRVWVRVGPGDVAQLHARLPHYCHAATLGVLGAAQQQAKD